jgi:hypothetical protein
MGFIMGCLLVNGTTITVEFKASEWVTCVEIEPAYNLQHLTTMLPWLCINKLSDEQNPKV